MHGPLASFITDFWHDQLVSRGQQGTFLVLLGFLGSFGFIRMSTRIMRSPKVSWWPGSVVSDGGVHVHHLVFGIVAMIAGGVMAIGIWDSPWWEISCAIFGIGVGLTVDEFALWLHLDDVYWSEEGRSSVDAAVVAALGMGLVILGVKPFDFEGTNAGTAILSLVIIALEVLAVGVCFLKKRLWNGWLGLFLFPFAFYGACRLGKPNSWWATHRYGARDPAKQARAEARFRPDRRTERFKNVFRDVVGGTPTNIYEAKLAERRATEEAAQAVRDRAERRAEVELAAAERRAPERQD